MLEFVEWGNLEKSKDYLFHMLGMQYIAQIIDIDENTCEIAYKQKLIQNIWKEYNRIVIKVPRSYYNQNYKFFIV